MLWYLSKRILRIPFVLLSISFVIFYISKNVPQDTVLNILELEGKAEQNNSTDGYTKVDYLQIAKQNNLDLPNFYFGLRPSHFPKNRAIFPSDKKQENEYLQQEKRISFPVFQWNGANNQYHKWLANISKGNFGISFIDGKQVSNKIWDAFQWTIILVIISILLSFILGISLGVFSKTTKQRRTAEFFKMLSYLLYAIPVFWFATIMLIFFTTDDYGSWTNIFPTISVIDPTEQGFWGKFASSGKLLLLPILVTSLHALGYISRQMESSLSQEIGKPYARTALSKGLTYRSMVTKHGFKNAILPIITLLSSAIPGTIAGSVIIETIFNIPGLGRLIFQSIMVADWNVVFGVVFLVAIITSVSFLISDLLYAKSNPKIRLDTA